MKNLSGQDDQESRRKMDMQGFYSRVGPPPPNYCTPNKMSGVAACSLEVNSAVKSVSCPDSPDFHWSLPQTFSMGNVTCLYCVFLIMSIIRVTTTEVVMSSIENKAC